ncbi:DODA-type extradiol aromatic ring-opening family dioxygenase [Alicyclobacillus vulcanalis]|uniref:Aromatic ring-opening dioxygenase, LigB subunit n=1 Tax=Alicyclobacillus vulcanalis TaxID=252246 RepID=A0A1N7M5A8_9BACL|nr:extradiol ring-cleavage dioxygenase [Alicyclobacillus vulcanalis]SIS81274.1 Aromatic ring-opening dioxygenase, LigB subunit [Alicyclobacillus vulcanalis]
MSIVFAAVAPHGLPILPELAGDEAHVMAQTRASLTELGQAARQADPDVWVVITPHGIRAEGQFTLSASAYMEGELSEQTQAAMVRAYRADKGNVFHMRRAVDRALALEVAHRAQDVPLAILNFATADGPLSTLPLDWGSMIPLYFMPERPIVVIQTARSRPFSEHLRLGQAIRQACDRLHRRAGVIASCDWAHAHAADGPYGFHEDAPRLDEEVQRAIAAGELERLADFPPEMIENARPDGMWQALVLAGAVPKEERRPHLLSYERPTYFGMLVAQLR